MRLRFSSVLDAPLEQVFLYQADPARWPEYIPAVVEVRPLGSPELVVGSRWAQVDRMGPLLVRMVQELEAIEAPRRVVWRTGAPYHGVEETVCTPEGPGTRVSVTFDARPTGWLRLLDLVPDRLLVRGSYAADLARLERLLASTSAG